jgi:hypothetical protein
MLADIPVIYIIAAAAMLMVVLFIFRRGGNRGSLASSKYAVHGILVDIKINLELIEFLIDGEQIKSFSTAGWNLHKSDIGFLGQGLQSILSVTFQLCEEYNSQVAGIKQFQTENYVAGIDLVKLKDMLKKSRSGLESWLMTHIGTTDPAGKSGIMDILFGRW